MTSKDTQALVLCGGENNAGDGCRGHFPNMDPSDTLCQLCKKRKATDLSPEALEALVSVRHLVDSIHYCNSMLKYYLDSPRNV